MSIDEIGSLAGALNQLGVTYDPVALPSPGPTPAVTVLGDVPAVDWALVVPLRREAADAIARAADAWLSDHGESIRR